MITYVCDGSHSGEKMGAGILRIEGLDSEQFHFIKKCKVNSNIHEVFAILKTLELIEEHHDYNCTIYNDCKMTLSAFHSLKRLSSNRDKGKVYPLVEKIIHLESKGYTINLKHTSELT